MYTQIFAFYNQSLTLLRKILVYFPVKAEEDEKEVLLAFRQLQPKDKVQVLNFVRVLAENDAT